MPGRRHFHDCLRPADTLFNRATLAMGYQCWDRSRCRAVHPPGATGRSFRFGGGFCRIFEASSRRYLCASLVEPRTRHCSGRGGRGLCRDFGRQGRLCRTLQGNEREKPTFGSRQGYSCSIYCFGGLDGGQSCCDLYGLSS